MSVEIFALGKSLFRINRVHFGVRFQHCNWHESNKIRKFFRCLHLQCYIDLVCSLSTKHIIFQHNSVVTAHERLYSFLPELVNKVAHFELVRFTFNAIYTNSLHCSRFGESNSFVSYLNSLSRS